MKDPKKAFRNKEYIFDSPIKLLEYRPCGLDIMIYSAMLGTAVIAIVFILAYRKGHLALTLTPGRVLCSIPFVVVATFFYSMLEELWVYPRKLVRKNTWTMEELMSLTKKNRLQTERIITRVLESSFVVADECIINERGDIPNGDS